jgi:hypothetical protein
VISPQPASPIIVKIIEPPRDPTGIAGVVVQAMGFTAVVAVCALLLGGLLAAVIVWIRSRSA